MISRRLLKKITLFALMTIVIFYLISTKVTLSQDVLTKYENTNIGVRFSYPSYWDEPSDFAEKGCLSCIINLGIKDDDNYPGFFTIKTLDSDYLQMCNCSTLMEYVDWEQKTNEETNEGYSIIGDNQTTVGKKYPAWQLEYSVLTGELKNKRTTYLEVLTKVNDTFYRIFYATGSNDPLARQRQLPEVRNVIDSIEFLPVQVQKLSNGSVPITNKTITYKNADLGVIVSYSSSWQKPTESNIPERNVDVVYLSINDRYGASPFIAIIKENEFSEFYKNCNCDVLKTFMQEVYKQLSQSQDFSFINDNQTTVGKKVSCMAT